MSQEAQRIPSAKALEALDAMEWARARAESAQVLAIALENYPNAIEGAETAAMAQMCIAATEAAETALERVRAVLTATDQNADYWRGYVKMGPEDDGKVRDRVSDYARYEIMKDGEVEIARLHMLRPKGYELSPFELEIEKVIEERIVKTDLAGKYGCSIDPYKAAESILAEHYGYAKMVESHYDWKPGIIYEQSIAPHLQGYLLKPERRQRRQQPSRGQRR